MPRFEGFTNRARMAVFFAGLLLSLTGCETAKFYTQAARGQWEILAKRKPTAMLIADPATPAKLKDRLVLINRLREFAIRELHLPAERAYDSYADLGRKHVVWVVYAAPEFSLTPKTWWYPVLGKMDYRGYFSERDAKACAMELKEQGHDVFVGGVDAYSTLGWFADPLLNTFTFDKEFFLAETLFHELTHRRLYLPGDTELNEAFATAVGEEGVRRWLKSQGRLEDLKKYEHALADERRMIALGQGAQRKLRALYSQKACDPASMLIQKEKIMEELRSTYAHLLKEKGKPLDGEKLKSVNNAWLNTISTYYDLVPNFQRLLASEGGDLEKFYARVKQIKGDIRKW